MPIVIDGTNGISGVNGSASSPAFEGTDADSGIFINSANEVNASLNSTPVWSAVSTFGFKNRIINGAIAIDQRNNGASQSYGATGSTYCVDRFFLGNSQTGKVTSQQNAGAVTPPAGFQNYLGVTVDSAVTIGASDAFYLSQAIEGCNLLDLQWGTSNAQPITVSAWVRSSITGTFGGAVINSGAISPRRTYCFTYSIPVANTWTYITVTIPGDTTGTWYQVGNGVGIYLVFSYGMGSSNSTTANSFQNSSAISVTGSASIMGTLGATFYITGVQLEKGSTATSFDYRPYGTELALCQRYYFKSTNNNLAYTQWAIGRAFSTTNGTANIPLPVPMRAKPTLGYTTPVSGNFDYSITALSEAGWGTGSNSYSIGCTGSFTSGGAFAFAGGNTTNTVYFDLSAEL
jgi:hypothetical protein